MLNLQNKRLRKTKIWSIRSHYYTERRFLMCSIIDKVQSHQSQLTTNSNLFLFSLCDDSPHFLFNRVLLTTGKCLIKLLKANSVNWKSEKSSFSIRLWLKVSTLPADTSFTLKVGVDVGTEIQLWRFHFIRNNEKILYFYFAFFNFWRKRIVVLPNLLPWFQKNQKQSPFSL